MNETVSLQSDSFRGAFSYLSQEATNMQCANMISLELSWLNEIMQSITVPYRAAQAREAPDILIS